MRRASGARCARRGLGPGSEARGVARAVPAGSGGGRAGCSHGSTCSESSGLRHPLARPTAPRPQRIPFRAGARGEPVRHLRGCSPRPPRRRAGPRWVVRRAGCAPRRNRARTGAQRQRRQGRRDEQTRGPWMTGIHGGQRAGMPHQCPRRARSRGSRAAVAAAIAVAMMMMCSSVGLVEGTFRGGSAAGGSAAAARGAVLPSRAMGGRPGGMRCSDFWSVGYCAGGQVCAWWRGVRYVRALTHSVTVAVVACRGRRLYRCRARRRMPPPPRRGRCRATVQRPENARNQETLV